LYWESESNALGVDTFHFRGIILIWNYYQCVIPNLLLALVAIGAITILHNQNAKVINILKIN